MKNIFKKWDRDCTRIASLIIAILICAYAWQWYYVIKPSMNPTLQSKVWNCKEKEACSVDVFISPRLMIRYKSDVRINYRGEIIYDDALWLYELDKDGTTWWNDTTFTRDEALNELSQLRSIR